MSAATHAAWQRIAEHYKRLSVARASEGPGVQLACLVLAEYCAHLWAGTSGGPSLAIVALAEHVLGDRLDEVVAAALVQIEANGRGAAS